MASTALIAVRVEAEIKQRFQALAAHQWSTESALLKRMVELSLQAITPQASIQSQAPYSKQGRGQCVTIRLSNEDHRLLQARAAARSMAAATYVSVLVRAHLRELTPLPKDELVALKRSVAELSAIGRNLNQLARAANTSGRLAPPVRDDLCAMLRICEG